MCLNHSTLNESAFRDNVKELTYYLVFFFAFVLPSPLFQGVPEPPDDPVRVVEAAVVVGVPPEVPEVDGRVVPGDEPLHLGRREELQPVAGLDRGGQKLVPRFGEFCSCSCLPLLPQLD